MKSIETDVRWWISLFFLQEKTTIKYTIYLSKSLSHNDTQINKITIKKKKIWIIASKSEVFDGNESEEEEQASFQ